MGMPPVENERTVRVSSVLSRVGAKATYTYDLLDALGDPAQEQP
jgi:hypothetical protein